VKNSKIRTIEWRENTLFVIDQRYIPIKEEFVQIDTLEQSHMAIKDMLVRGAPLIGFTAIFGMALFCKHQRGVICQDDFIKAAEYLKTARPTAVNLEYEVDRCVNISKVFSEEGKHYEELFNYLVDYAHEQLDLISKSNLKMAKFALKHLDSHCRKDHYRVMTICNTGSLACGPMGTALGVINYLHQEQRLGHVYATETRPYQQGIRLTSYELMKEGIEHEVTVEGAFSYILENKSVDAIFVGADRIAANGDSANKIGTSTLAIVAKYYNVPFFVVAPTSTFDLNLDSGKGIPIELRDEEEILSCQGVRIAPAGARALNPSFDVTDSKNISGLICENGTISPITRAEVERVVKNG